MYKKFKKFKLSYMLFSLTVAISMLFSPLSYNSKTLAADSYPQDASVNNKVNFNTDVIYQIVIDRFSDGDTSNNPKGGLYDSTKTNLKKYFGGDWQGVINKINDGYLSDMGITAIWVSQPVENIYSVFPDGSTSYHGYWARDFKKTNPAFGSMKDFKNMVNAAHAKNIKVVIDFAPNHTSPADRDNSSYAENGRLYDNGNLIGGYTNDTKKLFHHNGGTDFSSIEDGIYRNLYDLADLDHQNSIVDSYMKDAVKVWLDTGIDGIRMDAVKHMPQGWQKSFMDTVYGYKPVFTFGEWFLGQGEVDPQNSYFANNSGMSLLDFRYAQKVRQVLRDGNDNMYGLDSVISSTANDYEHVNDQVTFIDNHDMDRFQKSGANTKSVDEALVLTLTSRGVPAIYYGTEQYMTGNGDPNNRAMMSGFNKTTNAYKVIQKLAPLRKTNPAIAYGTTQQRWINNDVYIYERKFGNNVALVAINKNQLSSYNISNAITALPQGNYKDVLGGLVSGNNISVDSKGTVSTFTLAPGACAVWSYVANSNSPIIGHIGNPMAEPGEIVTIDGRGFGDTKGNVLFGTKTASIVSWSDRQVKVKVPNVPAGKINVSLKTSSGIQSNIFENYDVLTGKQVSVRFVVNNANTQFGENVYLVGDVNELGSWDTSKALGAMYNQVEYKYPTWYFDVSVPAGKTINFKFIKKNGSKVTWESGNNHVYTTPTNSTDSVIVDWQN
ncbi:alpha-amylase family glycosyl hydrolase [Clostridium sp. MB40-C1]|uniref:alpha-amylase family glycosyl hydrolase n=1 Tax=Clostridium sp. MB40-C1 TaxID=3070996 RepID=UPI0027DF6A32|nr:alpha-amylase family glycosyl hydrolase [Clostridium sp. MB40-C1]WMJ81512.1 alpha-amylase family glycosyl hydrolase [Clostridium sp. MB40-C1]